MPGGKARQGGGQIVLSLDGARRSRPWKSHSHQLKRREGEAGREAKTNRPRSPLLQPSEREEADECNPFLLPSATANVMAVPFVYFGHRWRAAGRARRGEGRKRANETRGIRKMRKPFQRKSSFADATAFNSDARQRVEVGGSSQRALRCALAMRLCCGLRCDKPPRLPFCMRP